MTSTTCLIKVSSPAGFRVYRAWRWRGKTKIFRADNRVGDQVSKQYAMHVPHMWGVLTMQEDARDWETKNGLPCQLATWVHHDTYSIHNQSFATIFCPSFIHETASVTISSMMALALFLSLTTAAALPIRNGRAWSMVSSSISSPRTSKSCSTGIVPLLVSCLISSARFSSHFWMYALFRTRKGRPCHDLVLRNEQAAGRHEP